MMMKKINFAGHKGFLGLLVALLCLSFSSCEKKWKKTTSVNFEFSVAPGTGHEYLEFHNGYMNLKQFAFHGTRKKGSDVEFSNQVPDGTQISISSLTSVPSSIPYDIPQGIYNDINITLDVTNNNTQLSKIYMTGVFIKDTQFSYPVVFEIKTSEFFDVQALHADGSTEIVLVEDKPARASVSFDMSYWFANVTRNMLENADVNAGNITISIAENSAIYDVVIGRIKNSCKVVFL